MLLLNVSYQYFFGNVSLEYLQSLNRGYEFQLKNDTPSDRVVKRFRVDPPRTQQVVYKITDDVYAEKTDRGETILPGGNTSYVPAAEFRELDGQKIPANDTLKFRIPPLTSRTWMAPEATIVDIKYELESTNSILRAIDGTLGATGLRSSERRIRYLVVDNYWTVSHSEAIDEALRVACRDDDSFAKLGVCSGSR